MDIIIKNQDSAKRTPHVPDKTRKAAHEQTYYAIERDHGKKAADKFWNKRKLAY